MQLRAESVYQHLASITVMIYNCLNLSLLQALNLQFLGKILWLVHHCTWFLLCQSDLIRIIHNGWYAAQMITSSYLDKKDLLEGILDKYLTLCAGLLQVQRSRSCKEVRTAFPHVSADPVWHEVSSLELWIPQNGGCDLKEVASLLQQCLFVSWYLESISLVEGPPICMNQHNLWICIMKSSTYLPTQMQPTSCLSSAAQS